MGAGGYTDGQLTNAYFFGPVGLAVDTSGVFYIADQANNLIRRISQGRQISFGSRCCALKGNYCCCRFCDINRWSSTLWVS
jgi:hypothetical protein